MVQNAEAALAKFVLLDRDGVINVAVRNGYVISVEQVRVLPGVGRAIARLNAHGYRVVVVSNQQCVGKGLISQADLDAITEAICEEVRAEGGSIEAFLYCPHLASDGCACRKPAPGLVLEAQRRYGFDLAQTYFIGDSHTDLETARQAGCRALFVLSGLDAEPCGPGSTLVGEGVKVFKDLEEAVIFLTCGVECGG